MHSVGHHRQTSFSSKRNRLSAHVSPRQIFSLRRAQSTRPESFSCCAVERAYAISVNQRAERLRRLLRPVTHRSFFFRLWSLTSVDQRLRDLASLLQDGRRRRRWPLQVEHDLNPFLRRRFASSISSQRRAHRARQRVARSLHPRPKPDVVRGPAHRDAVLLAVAIGAKDAPQAGVSVPIQSSAI